MKKFGIIFDMDGVIVDNHEFHFKAWQKMCEKYGKPLDHEAYRDHMNGRTLNEVVEYIFDEPMTKEKVREIGMEKEELYRKLYQPYLTPTMGLLKLLGDAWDAGIPMIVGTSAPQPNVHFTIEGLGIGHYFKDILDERAVTKGKPNPEIYQKCAKAAGLSNSDCVVIEDAISGIKAGKAAGSKVIGVASSHSRDELSADLVIDDFRQIDLKQIAEIISNK
jgi:beta-phosphoglucomutase-like phosphatase (HAD superfamily)